MSSEGDGEQGPSRYLPAIRLVGVAAAKGGLSLIPGGGLITELINAIERHDARKEEEVLALTIDILSTDISVLRSRLENDDELAALWTRGLRAATTAQAREKLQLFAAILAGTVDASRHQRLVASAVLRVLEQLGEEDVEVLSLIRQGEDNPPEGPQDPPNFRGASQRWLEDHTGDLRQLLPICLGNLSRLTLIQNAWKGTYGETEGRVAWQLAPLGRELVEVIARQAS